MCSWFFEGGGSWNNKWAFCGKESVRHGIWYSKQLYKLDWLFHQGNNLMYITRIHFSRAVSRAERLNWSLWCLSNCLVGYLWTITKNFVRFKPKCVSGHSEQLWFFASPYPHQTWFFADLAWYILGPRSLPHPLSPHPTFTLNHIIRWSATQY